MSREKWNRFVEVNESLFKQGEDAGIHPIRYANRVIEAAEKYAKAMDNLINFAGKMKSEEVIREIRNTSDFLCQVVRGEE